MLIFMIMAWKWIGLSSLDFIVEGEFYNKTPFKFQSEKHINRLILCKCSDLDEAIPSYVKIL